jgi:GAF domain-containing protein
VTTVDTDLLVEQARSLLAGESDPIANAANLSALIFGAFPDLNWAGFYFVRGEELVLGPFQGKVACTRIARGAGVCGTAWARAETIVVPDVHAFPGHIACDSASESEVVVPMTIDGIVVAVLDLDSPAKSRFSPSDVASLERLAAVYVETLRASGPQA